MKISTTKILATLAIILSSALAFAGQVMVKGKTLDKYTGKPVGVNVEFKDPNGKKIKVKSNTLTGEYQQLLEGGKNYEVTVFESEVYRQSFDLNTQNSSEAYSEQMNDMQVIIMNDGVELERIDGFSGSTQLTSDANDALKGLNKMMRFNRGLKLIIAAADDAKLNAIKTVTMKNKRLTDRITYKVDASLSNEIAFLVDTNENLFEDGK
ncbi:MAG: hypothetical protein Kapaf2KO_20850 [Candidatus Kapaibacteriales bacterium]